MKFAGLQVFLSLAAMALGASNVYDLDAATFQDHIDAHDIVLAEFFAPWCGHCKNLAPEYEEAADAIKAMDHDITLAKIDCTENEELCAEHEIRGFPTLNIFEKGKLAGHYPGARKAADIVSYLEKRTQPAVTKLSTAAEIDEAVAENQASSPIIFAYFGPEKHVSDYEQLASAHRDSNIKFLSSVGNKELAKKYGGDLVVFRDTMGAPIAASKAFSGEISSGSLAEYLETHSFPVFGELDASTFQRYVESKKPMLYAFVESEEHRELFKRALAPHVDGLEGKANIVFLNATLYGRHAPNVNLKEEFPAMALHDLASNKKYIHDQTISVSEGSIGDFVAKYLANELEVSVRSQPIPEIQEEPAYTLVGKEWESIVLDSDKDVLVEYYAPWCGHCKNLAPIYNELAELYEDNDNVVIAKMDHTENDAPVDISGYPTIILYAAGNKDEPLEYKGDRTLEDLANFVNLNGNAKVGESKPKKAASESESTASTASSTPDVLIATPESTASATATATKAKAEKDEDAKKEL